mgnify:CR=1 FL=1
MQLYVVQAIATDTYTYIQFIFIYSLTVGANIVSPETRSMWRYKKHLPTAGAPCLFRLVNAALCDRNT